MSPATPEKQSKWAGKYRTLLDEKGRKKCRCEEGAGGGSRSADRGCAKDLDREGGDTNLKGGGIGREVGVAGMGGIVSRKQVLDLYLSPV